MLTTSAAKRTWTMLMALVFTTLSAQLKAQQPVVRDSAGVRIVQNRARATAPVVFQLGSRPIFEVGGLEDNPDNEFDHHQGYLRGVRLSNGGLAAIDVVRVQYFDKAGKRVRISGRAGEGPEEFRYVTSICRTRGDTIVVNDSRNGRLGILDGKGNVVRTLRTSEIGSPPFNGCFDDGTVLLSKALSEGPSTPGAPRISRLSRVRMDGSVAQVFGDFKLPPFDMVAQSEPTLIAAGPTLYFGDALHSEIKAYNAPGKLKTIIRTADVQQKITDDDVDRRLSGSIPNNVSAAERKDRMAMMRSRPHADTWPAYGRVHVDPLGTMWVQDYRMKYPSPDAWTAFDKDGRLIGRLVLPAPAQGKRGLEIISFGVNEILVRRVDDDDASHLTIYPIQSIGR